MDEAEKEYKKIIERINEGQDAMKVSFKSSSYVRIEKPVCFPIHFCRSYILMT